jgi:triacylglycerol lipase
MNSVIFDYEGEHTMSNGERFPIVLAHGIARFDILREFFVTKLSLPEGDLNDQFHYFKGIKSYLEDNGFKVYHTSVDFAGRVDTRAEQLANQINQILSSTGIAKVHIIAHSMGGLDARRMIVDIEGMTDRVASLTTIGTPHLGTSFADFGIGTGGRFVIKGLQPIINLEGFEDLTTTACADFNNRSTDKEVANSVKYQTYASAEEHDLVFLPLQLSWFIIDQNEGENDGLVSVTSQQWKEELVGSDGSRKRIAQFRFPVPADHLNEVGWWDPQETNPFLGLLNPGKQAREYELKIKEIYLRIARDL